MLGPRQLSPVCCLGCCLPLRYADIVWSVYFLTGSIKINFGSDRDQGVNDDLELDIDDDQVPGVQLAALQSLLSGQGGDPQVI